MTFRHRDRTIGPVSTSIGVAAFPEHGGTINSLLNAADAALYRAKARQGDAVELAVPTLPAAAGRYVQYADKAIETAVRRQKA